MQAYLHTMSLVREPMRSKLFSAKLHAELGGYKVEEAFRRYARRATTDDPLGLVQYLDIKTYLNGDINTKVDRASMAHSLEVREPLMDHPLVEWCATLPTALKVNGNEGKYLLKKAMEPHLPREIMYRTKMGFAVPIERWFRGPLRQRVRDDLLSGALIDTGFFNPDALRKLVVGHQEEGREYSGPLWSLLMFEAFLRNLSKPRAQDTPAVRTAVGA